MKEYLYFIWFEGSPYPRVRVMNNRKRNWSRTDGKVKAMRRATRDEEVSFYSGRLDVGSLRADA